MATAWRDAVRRSARAQVPLTPVPMGPWRGRKSSVTRDLVPSDYVYTGDDALFVPNSEIEGRKGVGHWRRRDGQTQLFDTFGASVGLLPAKWSSKARWMEPFSSDSITDGYQTVIALVTREDIAANFIDDGRFSNIFIRDQVQSSNYTLGSEYSATTYPPPGAVQAYKYVPIWHDSGDGGLTRGITEFDRRFWAGGSRRFLRVQNWWYFPNLFGTPWRTQFGSSESGIVTVLPKLGGAQGGSFGIVDGIGGTNAALALQTNDGDTSHIESGAGPLQFYVQMNAIASPPTSCTVYAWVKGVAPDTAWDLWLYDTVPPFGGGPGTGIIKFAFVPSGLAGGAYSLVSYTLTPTEIATITGGVNGWSNIHVGFRSFGITWASQIYLAVSGSNTSGVTRLIPSGPIPSTWPGYLTKGSPVTGTAAAETVQPNADRTDNTWLSNTATNVDLFSFVDDTSFTDYIHTATDNSECVIDFATPSGIPQEGDTVVVTVAAQVVGVLATANLTFKLMQGATQIASRAVLCGTTQTVFTLTLTDAQIASVTDWTDVRMSLTMTSHAVTLTDFRIGYFNFTWTPGVAEGGWKGSKRFFFSVAPIFEDGSTWKPVVPRLPSPENANGVGFFTVDINNPDISYDKITWTLPQGVFGVTAWRLLRSPSIDATLQDNRELDPTDLRQVAVVPAGTLIYNDFAGDDGSMEDDPSELIIHFRHSMPYRSRYIAGGEQRVATMYGGLNPACIEIAPLGVSADYDLNFSDTTASLYAATYASYMRVELDSAGAGQLVLVKSDGATLVTTKTFAFATYNTLDKLVDAINATSFAVDALQWRAQLCPGVDGGTNPNTALTPHKRVIASCVTHTSTSLTKSAGGLSKVAIGMRISKADVPVGTYVLKIVSDTELTMSAAATGSTTSDTTFYTNTGDDPTVATANTGYQRVIANSWPGFIYFNSTFLATFGVLKSTTWLTAASPFQTRSAANNFVVDDKGRYTPPTDPGIGTGIAACDKGFVMLYERKRAYLTNTVGGGNSSEDRDYAVRFVNDNQGCVAWNSVVAGNGFVIFGAADGVYAGQITGNEYREIKVTDDTWRQFPDALGDFSYEMPLCVAAAAADTDGAYLSARVMRNRLWVNYRASGSHPNRQVVMDFSSGADSYGLRALQAEDGRPWGWSVPLIRSCTTLAEIVRSDGSHLYAWSEENAGSTGDGRIDEIEVGDTDNGSEITASVESGLIRADQKELLSAQHFALRHLMPTGATCFLDFYRGADGPYTLTLAASGSLPVTDEIAELTQPARVAWHELRWVWRQATGSTGGSGELRPSRLLLKRLPRYT